MQIGFEVQYNALAKALMEESPRQMPFVVARTLTTMANDAKKAIEERLPTAFDRPTAFTMKALTVTTATKANPVSSVQFKESQEERGKAEHEYIRPGAQGSPARNQKKTEFLLMQMGALPAGWVTVPGKTMKLDAYGNLSGRTYRQIINVLQLKVNTKYASGRAVSQASQKRAAKMKVATEMFVVPPGKNKLAKNGGWLPPGVWRHLPGRKLQQMLKFVAKASYQPRLDMDAIANETVASKLQLRFDESVGVALKTMIEKAK